MEKKKKKATVDIRIGYTVAESGMNEEEIQNCIVSSLTGTDFPVENGYLKDFTIDWFEKLD